MLFYSQNGEDLLLWDVFKDQKYGYYIDVGAFDGIHLSNSYVFELNGWDGMCVEGNPTYYDFCRKNRPQSICINAACTSSEKRGEIQYLVEPLGLLSGIEANKTIDIEERYARRNLVFQGFTEIIVNSSSLDDLLDKHLPNASTTIDFLSIDVEGTEKDVLLGLTYRPRIIITESHSKEQAKDLINLLSQRGYRDAITLGNNTFFASNIEDFRRLCSSKITGLTQATEHPLLEEQKQIAKKITINGTHVTTEILKGNK